MNSELVVYEGQRDVPTIAVAQRCSLGRLQEASMFGRASPALEVDRATTVSERIKLLFVQCQYVMRAPVDGGNRSKCYSLWLFMKFIIFGALNFFSYKQLSPVTPFRRSASCLDVEAEKVIP